MLSGKCKAVVPFLGVNTKYTTRSMRFAAQVFQPARLAGPPLFLYLCLNTLVVVTLCVSVQPQLVFVPQFKVFPPVYVFLF